MALFKDNLPQDNLPKVGGVGFQENRKEISEPNVLERISRLELELKDLRIRNEKEIELIRQVVVRIATVLGVDY